MVFKVQGNFNQDNFIPILDAIKKYFFFIFSDGNLFLAYMDLENIDEAYNTLISSLQPKEEFLVLKVNEKNIMKESPDIIEWCRDHLVRLDKMKYEKENQEKLHAYNSVLDNFENILKQEWMSYKDSKNNKNNKSNINSKSNNKKIENFERKEESNG